MGIFGPPNIEQLKAKRDIQGLIKALSYQKDGNVRCSACEALGDLQSAAAVEPLIAATADASPDVRRYAATALGTIGDARAVAGLVTLLKDTDKNIEIAVIGALSKIGVPAVNQLIVALKNPNDHTRACAAVALGRIGDPQAVKPLLTAYQEQKLRNSLNALVKIGPPAVDGLVAALVATCESGERDGRRVADYFSALTEIGAAAVDALIVALKDKNDWLRMLAAGMLGRIDGSLQDTALHARIVEALNATLKDGNKDVRMTAAQALMHGDGIKLDPPEPD